jgi:hypothetical protein
MVSVLNHLPLVDALRKREREYYEALGKLESFADEDDEARKSARELREAVEMVRVLRRIVPSCDLKAIHSAFGAPGDFGYDTPVGDALSRLYRGEP